MSSGLDIRFYKKNIFWIIDSDSGSEFYWNINFLKFSIDNYMYGRINLQSVSNDSTQILFTFIVMQYHV